MFLGLKIYHLTYGFFLSSILFLFSPRQIFFIEIFFILEVKHLNKNLVVLSKNYNTDPSVFKI